MVTYATAEDVANGYRALTESEQDACSGLIEEASVIIDTYAKDADADCKRIVACRMVRRAIANLSVGGAPIGSTQGSMTAGPYTQSWTFGSGASSGELYLSKTDKKLLGIGDKIGAVSPLEHRADTGTSSDIFSFFQEA